MQTYNLSDRVYVITGAAGGVGSTLARHLRSCGARLALGSRNPESLNALAAETDSIVERFDGADFASAETLVNAALEKYGQIDGAICCSGSILLKPAHLVTEAEYNATMAANASAAFALVRAAAKPMMAKGGSIVLFASAASVAGLSNHEAIAAAKGAVMGLTLSAAATYARYGIRVNCVAPGLVETPLTARITGNEASLKASQAMHALGRIGKPEDIAAAATWLLSDDSSWMSGNTLSVDGGLGHLRSKA
ncbi:MAG: 3-oxoacyl-[acyl-carrier-protein] reductase FabG [Pseudomonadota bacterium]